MDTFAQGMFFGLVYLSLGFGVGMLTMYVINIEKWCVAYRMLEEWKKELEAEK